VVLVAGTIPGERVLARLERERAGVLYATTAEVLEPHPARREPCCDPLCGGMSYAHIAPDHQRTLKAEVVADAFARIGRLPLPDSVTVAASPEGGYRMRARLHMSGGRLGSYREGTHEICDYTRTGQLLDATNEVIREMAMRLARRGLRDVAAIEIAENIAADERVLHVDTEAAAMPDSATLADLAGVAGVTGLSATSGGARPLAVAGRAWVADRLDALAPGLDARSAPLPLRRHARSFFQANRFLLPRLVAKVLERLAPGLLVDLYAGVGLFAVCAAARGQKLVFAIERDRTSAGDLRHNAGPFRTNLRVHTCAVEEFLASRPPRQPITLIVDPPRTGMSRRATDGVLRFGAERIVYVSCDVATLARDAARLVGAGYALTHIEAFDLFPNTPHVESLAVFDRR
jgi:23S rRNA (uracil1939-C5)-methyltransferase